MYWRLSASFKARLWNERRSVKELEAELKETQKRAVLVKQARAGMPANTGAYAERVAAMRARMDQLQQRLADVSAQQNRFLQALAIRELEGQKQRISTYQIQARYELAAIYDHAANDKPKAASHEARTPFKRASGATRRAGDGRRGAGRVLLAARRAHAANKNPPTIKDLDAQQVDVNTDPPKNVDANKTMDSYKRFLDLNAGDAALRAEALRRLGDLNLESSESERIERELVTNEGLRATEAIHLYSALLKTYPKYERNDSVLYQLARAYELNAQPDKALASLDQLVASYPNSHYIDEAQFRRGELLFSDKAYPKAQAAYEAVIKIGLIVRRSTTRAFTSMAGRCSSRARTSAAWIPLRACSIRCWCRSAIRPS